MSLSGKEIVDKTRRLQTLNHETEVRWLETKAAREGDLTSIAPDLVSEEWPKPIVSNFIDVVARDLAEMVAPLPSFNCSSATMQSDSARKFADKRAKIVQWYVAYSRLEQQMLYGADHYFTYGLAVFYMEPDFESRLPRIRVEDPVGGYAEWDRWGRVASYTKRFYEHADVLATRFPEFADQIHAVVKDNRSATGSADVELIRYCDKNQITLVLAAKEPMVLVDVENRLGETPVCIARRPWLEEYQIRGQFDDVVWVQVARDLLAKLQLEAVSKVVQAPMAMPADVQELAFGPDAIIRTANPEKVRRVGLELSPAAFTESQFLDHEMRVGARYPEARTGGVDASIITGRGVQALMGGFDSQIKAAQTSFKNAFIDMCRLCFKMDETYWPNAAKDVRGHAAGTPFNFTYRPLKDINGDYSVDVTYGFAAGMDPNRAVVMLLQLRGEKLFSRDYMARQLPFDLNVGEEMTKVDVEELREAIKQGVFAYVQSIPAMAQAGQDPAEAVQRTAMIVEGVRKGRSIEDVVAEAFAPQPPPEAPPAVPGAGGPSGEAGGLGPGGPGGGLTSSGLMRGVSPGQAGQAPGGRPDLSVMLAGLTGQGQPQMSAYTMRRRRI